MPSTPASLPPATAPNSDFKDLRSAAREGDRKSRAAIKGRHPAVWRVASFDTSELEEQLNRSPEQKGERPTSGAALKFGNSSTVSRVALPDGRRAVLKHYLPTKRIDPRDRLGNSKAIRSLLAAEALQRRGLSVATAWAAWSQPGRGSFLLMEDLADLLPLHLAVLEVQGQSRQALLNNVADVIRRMHRAGIAYRDLKPSNLLIRLPGLEVSDLHFLDHDRNRFLNGEVPPKQAMRDLAALHAGLPPQVRAAERFQALQRYDKNLTDRPMWRRYLPGLLEEASLRDHRWVGHELLSGNAAPISDL